jgi:protein-L-isoaspartate(D-aspartate) O-methyltransferase
MLSLLELDDFMNVLQIDSSDGYVLSLISVLSKNSKIIGLEKDKLLFKKSKILLNPYGVKVFCSSGLKGFKRFAPYDRILVSDFVSEVPDALVSQLKEGGILVCPINNSIFKVKKTANGLIKREFSGFNFVSE